MIHINFTEEFKDVPTLIKTLNQLPAYYRESTLKIKTYDGWKPMSFKWINNTWERVCLTMEELFTI